MISDWWSWPGSNRRPPPCKGGALPVELQPQDLSGRRESRRPYLVTIDKRSRGLVGLSGFEPLTSRLSAVRSSQLSYRPGGSARHPRLWDFFSASKERNGRSKAAECGSLKTRYAQSKLGGIQPCGLLRKEVIQPQVLLQLPCYDFTPITDHTVGACLSYELAQRLLVQPAFVM